MAMKLRKLLFGAGPDDPEFWLKKDAEGNTKLHMYAKEPFLASKKIPEPILTAENLALVDALGVRVIEYMGASGRIKSIPESSLTKELFGLACREEGRCILAHGIQHWDKSQISQLPAHLFEQNNGNLTDMGYALLNLAAKLGWAYVPAGLITSKHLNETPAGNLMREGDLTSKPASKSSPLPSCLKLSAIYGTISELPLDMISDNLGKYYENEGPLIHTMIGLGHVKALPKECITVDILLMQDIRGRTVLEQMGTFNELKDLPSGFLAENFELLISGAPNFLHVMASLGYLARIPPGLIKSAHFLREAPNGLTALHSAARCGHISYIPPELLTDENMRKLANGISVYQEAANGGCLNDIPRCLITQSLLAEKDICGKPLLACVIGANSRESAEYTEFVHGLLTVENLAWGREGENIMQIAGATWRADRIPITLPVPESYKQYLTIPLNRNDGTVWWDAHMDYVKSVSSLVPVEELPDIDIF